MPIVVSVLTGGANNHQTTSEEANGTYTDFVSEGCIGTLANTSGVAPATGGFAVNAQGTPDTTIAVTAGVAYVTGIPTSQNSQTFRVKNTVSSNVTISANSSGSTKYDWIYIKLDPTNLATPNLAGDNVATLLASRSSSATSDDGTPPTYGYPLAIVTVANGFATITIGKIADIRTNATVTGNSGADPYALYDFIESGCVWTADSVGVNLLASMTGGWVWILGKRLQVAPVTARAFTASRDTYIDFSDSGSGTVNVTYTAETNNAASSTLSANRVRCAIIISGVATIATTASINQGQEDRILPIASSTNYSTTDSIGNIICPRDPNRKLLAYRASTNASFSTASTSAVIITGASGPIIVPTGRKYVVHVNGAQMYNSGVAQSSINVYEGATLGALTTIISGMTAGANTAAGTYPPVFSTRPRTPASSTVFVSVSGHASASGTSNFTSITFRVELL